MTAHLSGVTRQSLDRDPVFFGHFLENFVVNELRKQKGWSDDRVELHHYRTTTGREVDVLLEDAAAKAMLGEDAGLLCAATAFGKTVVTAWIIAQRQVNTLILVHRRQLMEQWRERLASFLDIPQKNIGQVGSGRRKLTGEFFKGSRNHWTRSHPGYSHCLK